MSLLNSTSPHSALLYSCNPHKLPCGVHNITDDVACTFVGNDPKMAASVVVVCDTAISAMFGGVAAQIIRSRKHDESIAVRGECARIPELRVLLGSDLWLEVTSHRTRTRRKWCRRTSRWKRRSQEIKWTETPLVPCTSPRTYNARWNSSTPTGGMVPGKPSGDASHTQWY